MLNKILIFLGIKERKDFEVNGKKVKIMVNEKNINPFDLFLKLEEEQKYKIANIKELHIFLKKYKPKKTVYAMEYYGDIKNIFERKVCTNRIRGDLIENVEINPVNGVLKDTEILLIEK
jgi:hypothetical protein